MKLTDAPLSYLDGNWHDWNGGACPVPADAMVEVQRRDETRDEVLLQNGAYADPAKYWDWSIDDVGGDIVAFRVIGGAL